jgi:hypothetical protein
MGGGVFSFGGGVDNSTSSTRSMRETLYPFSPRRWLGVGNCSSRRVSGRSFSGTLPARHVVARCGRFVSVDFSTHFGITVFQQQFTIGHTFLLSLAFSPHYYLFMTSFTGDYLNSHFELALYCGP